MYGKSACPVLRGAGVNWSMDEIWWHRRESRRQTENTNICLEPGSGMTQGPNGAQPNGLGK